MKTLPPVKVLYKKSVNETVIQGLEVNKQCNSRSPIRSHSVMKKQFEPQIEMQAQLFQTQQLANDNNFRDRALAHTWRPNAEFDRQEFLSLIDQQSCIQDDDILLSLQSNINQMVSKREFDPLFTEGDVNAEYLVQLEIQTKQSFTQKLSASDIELVGLAFSRILEFMQNSQADESLVKTLKSIQNYYNYISIQKPTQIRAFEDAVKRMDIENVQLQDQIKQLNLDLQFINTQVDQKDRQILKCKEQEDKLRISFYQYDSMIDQLTRQITSLQCTVDSQKNENEQMHKQYEDMKQRAKRLTQNLMLVKPNIDKIKQQRDFVTVQLQESQDVKEQLNGKIVLKDQKLAENQQQITSLLVSVENLRNEIENLQQQFALSMQNQIQLQQQELNNISDNSFDIQSKVKEIEQLYNNNNSSRNYVSQKVLQQVDVKKHSLNTVSSVFQSNMTNINLNNNLNNINKNNNLVTQRNNPDKQKIEKSNLSIVDKSMQTIEASYQIEFIQVPTESKQIMQKEFSFANKPQLFRQDTKIFSKELSANEEIEIHTDNLHKKSKHKKQNQKHRQSDDNNIIKDQYEHIFSEDQEEDLAINDETIQSQLDLEMDQGFLKIDITQDPKHKSLDKNFQTSQTLVNQQNQTKAFIIRHELFPKLLKIPEFQFLDLIFSQEGIKILPPIDSSIETSLPIITDKDIQEQLELNMGAKDVSIQVFIPQNVHENEQQLQNQIENLQQLNTEHEKIYDEQENIILNQQQCIEQVKKADEFIEKLQIQVQKENPNLSKEIQKFILCKKKMYNLPSVSENYKKYRDKQVYNKDQKNKIQNNQTLNNNQQYQQVQNNKKVNILKDSSTNYQSKNSTSKQSQLSQQVQEDESELSQQDSIIQKQSNNNSQQQQQDVIIHQNIVNDKLQDIRVIDNGLPQEITKNIINIIQNNENQGQIEDQVQLIFNNYLMNITQQSQLNTQTVEQRLIQNIEVSDHVSTDLRINPQTIRELQKILYPESKITVSYQPINEKQYDLLQTTIQTILLQNQHKNQSKNQDKSIQKDCDDVVLENIDVKSRISDNDFMLQQYKESIGKIEKKPIQLLQAQSQKPINKQTQQLQAQLEREKERQEALRLVSSLDQMKSMSIETSTLKKSQRQKNVTSVAQFSPFQQTNTENLKNKISIKARNKNEIQQEQMKQDIYNKIQEAESLLRQSKVVSLSQQQEIENIKLLQKISTQALVVDASQQNIIEDPLKEYEESYYFRPCNLSNLIQSNIYGITYQENEDQPQIKFLPCLLTYNFDTTLLNFHNIDKIPQILQQTLDTAKFELTNEQQIQLSKLKTILPSIADKIQFIKLSSLGNFQQKPVFITLIESYLNLSIKQVQIQNEQYIEIPLHNVQIKSLKWLLQTIQLILNDRSKAANSQIFCQSQNSTFVTSKTTKIYTITTSPGFTYHEIQYLPFFIIRWAQEKYKMKSLVSLFIFQLISTLIFHSTFNNAAFIFQKFLFFDQYNFSSGDVFNSFIKLFRFFDIDFLQNQTISKNLIKLSIEYFFANFTQTRKDGIFELFTEETYDFHSILKIFLPNFVNFRLTQYRILLQNLPLKFEPLKLILIAGNITLQDQSLASFFTFPGQNFVDITTSTITSETLTKLFNQLELGRFLCLNRNFEQICIHDEMDAKRVNLVRLQGQIEEMADFVINGICASAGEEQIGSLKQRFEQIQRECNWVHQAIGVFDFQSAEKGMKGIRDTLVEVCSVYVDEKVVYSMIIQDLEILKQYLVVQKQ